VSFEVHPVTPAHGSGAKDKATYARVPHSKRPLAYDITVSELPQFWIDWEDPAVALRDLQSVVRITNDLRVNGELAIVEEDWAKSKNRKVHKITEGVRSITRKRVNRTHRVYIVKVQLFVRVLERAFLGVMDMSCRHKGNHPQTIIDTVYDVRLPAHSPNE